ncbi:MAG: alpha-glucan family phosphorylase [Candidatus Eisenbacteria bacterium]|nr:alpha-glucan family phosphorylase [Candidatus Eisenbacteria bacterium]
MNFRKEKTRIAYFSMEIGLDSKIPTYSGGLGVLAGDTIRSCADLNVPIIAVTLLYRDGYFRQKLDAYGNQEELASEWNPGELLALLPVKVSVQIETRTVSVQAWEYLVTGIGGHVVPVIFLDADVPENGAYDRSLTHCLYGGDDKYRLCQEVILGVGGVRMLKELGYHEIVRYHMNEGHSSLLTLELLNERKKSGAGRKRVDKIDDTRSDWDVDGVRRMCVFTTHTPVPAGHDQFSYSLVSQVFGDFIPVDFLKQIGGGDTFNMTLLAMNLSHYENGVAKEHGKVSQVLYPGYHIDSITNGIYSANWVCDSFKGLFDKYIPGWRNDPFSLRYALSIPKEEIWSAHREAKRELIDYTNAKANAGMDGEVLTIGFARRATAYKRANLVFSDVERLTSIAGTSGRVQFIFSGKAHPRDMQGKELIKQVVAVSRRLGDQVRVAYLENYDMELARMLIAGADLWLNTPRKPEEASGTSGMKAAHNGVPSLSILDGWWIEGCIEGLTGWSIGTVVAEESSDVEDAGYLYDRLEKVVIPTFYGNRDRWIEMMRHSIAINGSFFNTHRMVLQYVLNAYTY